MATQQNPFIYGKAIQYQLAAIVTPVPVYAAFNRNFATEPKFITWTLRNVHQPVYTGSTQSNKGIDRPVFQISIFTQSIEDGFTISNQILQALHGYSGFFGGTTGWLNNAGQVITWTNVDLATISWTSPNTGAGFYISKADVQWLYNSYDNENKLAEIFLDCTIDVPT
jgi:hypothetical protein